VATGTASIPDFRYTHDARLLHTKALIVFLFL
jgi:hypothetical protein